MLINTEVNIKITNDGERNMVSVQIGLDEKIIDCLTAVEMAKEALNGGIQQYTSGLPYKPTTKQFKQILNNLLIKDLKIK